MAHCEKAVLLRILGVWDSTTQHWNRDRLNNVTLDAVPAPSVVLLRTPSAECDVVADFGGF